MPGGREALRRALIWALVAAWLASGIVVFIATGEYWTLLAWGGFTIVGAVILNARPGNWIGRIMMAIGLYWPTSVMVLLPGVVVDLPVWVEMLVIWLGYLVWAAVPLLVLVFPTGRIGTLLGRGVAWFLVAVATVMLAVTVVDPAPLEYSRRVSPLAWPAASSVASVLHDSGVFLILTAIAAALTDLILRWRRARGRERLQFRWLAYGTTVTIATLVVNLPEPGPEWVGALIIVWINAIPVSIGIAVTRHGLYEIGRVVSRTVTYAVVTVLAIATYALVVTSVSLLLPDQSAVPVALATLAAAAVFLPALRWLQRIVDRRFDRERYDAEKIVDAFGRRLRDGADPASTAPEVLVAVERTLQPAAVGLWTRSGVQ